MIFATTPSQTVGPYFAIGLPWENGPHAVRAGAPGAVRIAGTVYDGAGTPVPDHLVETWQADPDGRFADACGHGGDPRLAEFRGFARCAARADGSYELSTVKPGPLLAPPTWPLATLAPHIAMSVFARGLLHRLVTRIYFADEVEANAADPILSSVPAERRATLLAQPTADGYRFDIHLQGPHETTFFAI